MRPPVARIDFSRISFTVGKTVYFLVRICAAAESGNSADYEIDHKERNRSECSPSGHGPSHLRTYRFAASPPDLKSTGVQKIAHPSFQAA